MLGTKDKLISNIPLWAPTHEQISVGWPVKLYIHQLSVATGCCLEDLPRMMANRDGWQGNLGYQYDDEDDDLPIPTFSFPSSVLR